MNATQKIRFVLTGDPNGEPHFQHEGANVVRWITGGDLPSVYATFHHRGAAIEVHCPTCDECLSEFPSDYSGDTGKRLMATRLLDHQH